MKKYHEDKLQRIEGLNLKNNFSNYTVLKLLSLLKNHGN